eukprot:gnl/Dysnectes_brevis/1364_a1533_1749.p1 GENE.gnl/Dysnectes_brevis/1364_a1533_1749~~gnl/Dysnectes_brevis/1364_a1533_1749.p1  ORF type:complete len:202 (+),score=81.91 gnl/Dysnectes_brevis/1364_a1533_1749:1243-1848(+)
MSCLSIPNEYTTFFTQDMTLLSELDALPPLSFAEYVASVLRTMLTVTQNPPQHQPAFGAEPRSSIRDWVCHILTRADCPRQCLVAALIILHRMCVEQPHLTITRQNCFRLFLTAVMISSKLLEDHTYTNVDWAVIGRSHYTPASLTRMEVEMLNLLQFRVHVPRSQFLAFVRATYARDPQEPRLPKPVSPEWRRCFKTLAV